MQLLGLLWAKAEPKLRGTRVRELLALQRPDGGWAQTPSFQSDAYATGQVLYTLRQLDMPTAGAALQRGTAYLGAHTGRRRDLACREPGDETSAVPRGRFPVPGTTVDLACRHRVGGNEAGVAASIEQSRVGVGAIARWVRCAGPPGRA